MARPKLKTAKKKKVSLSIDSEVFAWLDLKENKSDYINKILLAKMKNEKRLSN